jgi:hypothetical protein
MSGFMSYVVKAPAGQVPLIIRSNGQGGCLADYFMGQAVYGSAQRGGLTSSPNMLT